MKFKLFKLNKIVSIFVIAVLMAGFFVSHSQAADLTALSDTMSRLITSQDSDHTILFTSGSGVDAGETIEITFPSDFSTTNVDYTDIDVADDGADLTLGAVPNLATWGAAFGGAGNLTLTITSGTGTIAGGSIIKVEIGTNATSGEAGNQAINNPSANNTYNITIAGTFGDTGSINVVILTNDQVAVTGSIYTTLEFTISDNAIGFGSFTNTNVRYATADATGAFVEPANDLPVKLMAGTNATNGLTVTIRDEGSGTNAGLFATLVSELIPAAPSTEVIANSKKFGAYAKNTSGLTISEGFDNDSNADAAMTRSPQTFVSAASQVNGSVDLALLAATDATTKAGSYVDTITLICTGNY